MITLAEICKALLVAIGMFALSTVMYDIGYIQGREEEKEEHEQEQRGPAEESSGGSDGNLPDKTEHRDEL